MRRDGFLAICTSDKQASNIIVWVSVIYLFWLYSTSVLKAVLPFSVFQLIGKSLAGGMLLLFLVFQPKQLFAAGGKPFYIGIGLLAVVMVSSLLGSASLNEFMEPVSRIGSSFVLFLMFSSLGMDGRNLKIILWALAVLAAVNGLIGIWGAATQQSILPRGLVGVGTMGFDESTGRSGGLQGENYVGLWCAPALAVGLVNLVRKRFKILSLTLIGISLLATAVSLSRTSAMSAAAVLLVWWLTTKRRKINIGMVAIIIVALVIILYLGQGLITRQLSGFLELEREQQNRWSEVGTMAGRTDIWRDVTETALQKPFFGHGSESSLRFFGVVAHNAFLDMFIDYGFVGAAIFSCLPIFLIGTFVMRSRQIAGDDYLLMLYGLFFAGLMCWLSLSSAFLNIIWVCNGLIYGRILFVKRQENLNQHA